MITDPLTTTLLDLHVADEAGKECLLGVGQPGRVVHLPPAALLLVGPGLDVTVVG